MGSEPSVGLTKGTRAEETGMGREWGRVRRFKDKMLGLVDERFLIAGVAPPEDEDEVGSGIVEVFNTGFRESFPAVTAVRAGMVSFDGENII